MFGETYTFTEPKKKAVPGYYEIELTDVAERDIKGYAALTFTFKYKDSVNRVPNTFDLFDVVDKNDQTQINAFNNKMSKIALCFGLSGNFSPLSYRSWVGKKGLVYIKLSESGFLNVSDFIDKKEASGLKQV